MRFESYIQYITYSLKAKKFTKICVYQLHQNEFCKLNQFYVTMLQKQIRNSLKSVKQNHYNLASWISSLFHLYRNIW